MQFYNLMNKVLGHCHHSHQTKIVRNKIYKIIKNTENLNHQI